MRTTGKTSKLFTSVLCPVDFSEHAALALRYGAAIARRTGASLHPLFVNDPLLVAAAAAAYDRAALGAASGTELKRYVATSLGPRARGLKVGFHTALGKPAREAIRQVQAGGHDLLVVGTKGLNGARRLLLGSTTAALLRHSPVPVLAVPPAHESGAPSRAPGAAWPGRTIVAAIEFGPRAADEVLRAAEVARTFRARLLLLHVVEVPALPVWLSATGDEHLRRACGEAEAALEALRGEARGVKATAIVRVGHPPDQIATVAAEHGAGLIVMGLRGHEGLFGDRAGACAYQVLCQGAVPVLALPDIRRTLRTRR
ncbi:MAG: universal stress protein [Vicinamibacterales bacterium]